MSLRHPLITKIAALTLFSCVSCNLYAESIETRDPLSSSLNYDLVVAEIPYRQAKIASVALAQLQIALYKAKTRTERALCNGNWAPRGRTFSQTGPTSVIQADIKHSNWHYRSLRQAHPLACSNVTRAQFFLEMSRHLPEWVLIRPAGQFTAFKQGEIHTLPPKSIASR